MRSAPTASRIARATVVLPEPVPPATPRTHAVRPAGAGEGGAGTGDIAGIVPAGSTLATRAVVGAAAGLDDPPDGGPAARAGLALAAVGGERDLEVAAPPLAVGEVVERRAALPDGLPEHRD